MSDLIETLSQKIEKMAGIHFIKGLDHTHRICSDGLARVAGFKNSNKMIGKTDYDFCWEKYAPGYFRDDQLVFSGEPIVTVEYISDAYEKEHCIVVKKVPLKGTWNETIGLLGSADFINEKKFLKKFHHFKNLDLINHFFEAPETYQLKEQITGLTNAQFKVLFYYLRGFSIQELADLLCRSPRTIETHLVAIKEKLDVHTRREIFEKAALLGLIKYLPMDDFVEK